MARRTLIPWIAVAFLAVGAASAEVAAGAEGAPANPGLAEIERFVEEFWNDEGGELAAPGFVFAWVDVAAGSVLAAHGTAEITAGVPLDPERDVFRIGSVSKVFVGLAAARVIADAGLVDPHADVDDFVEFPIPAMAGPPITLHHLLTHTAGLDDRYFADTGRTAASQEPLGEHLARRLPPRIHPSGATMSYSNYGYALAAHLLERVTGADFADHVRRRILLPLGMGRSGYRLTPEMRAALATGYEREDGAYRALPYTYTHRYPSTTFATTAADMAKLLAALLREDPAAAAGPWSPRARRLALDRQAGPSPWLPGRTYAFAEWRRHRHRGLWHDGGTAGFAAELFLFPERGVGFFVADNLQSSGLSQSLKMALLDRFFPPVQPAPATPYVGNRLADYTGVWVPVRRAHRSVEKVRLLMDGSFEITGAGADGALRLGELRLEPVGRDIFRGAGTDRHWVFARDPDDRVRRLFLDWGGMPATLERLAWRDRPSVFLAIVGVLLALFTAATVYWLRRSPADAGRGFVAAAVGWTVLAWIFVVGVAVYLARLDPLAFRFGEAPGLLVLLCLPLAALVPGLFVGCQAARLALTAGSGRFARILGLTTSAGVLVYYWLLANWNLLGFRL